MAGPTGGARFDTTATTRRPTVNEATFHPGELSVQDRAGRHPRTVVRHAIPEVAANFLRTRPAIVLAGRATDDKLWATMLTGPAGFMQAPAPNVMVVDAVPRSDDPLAPLVAGGGEAGAIVWDDHRRMRVNGIVQPRAHGFAIGTVQVFSNCARYISERHPVADEPDWPRQHRPTEVARSLSAAQIEAIARADTFFIGTAHPDGPADASHRGGDPGFVVVDSPTRLRWPDYNGNGMFMTLGNIALEPRTALLFPDWSSGGLLQLSGRAEVDWDPAARTDLAGAERVVTFTVDEVRDTPYALPTRWSPARLSRFNPKPASARR